MEKWPFIWGKGTQQEVEIRENVRYLFPEDSAVAPYPAPDLQKLVDEGVDYSVDPEHLGTVDVVMDGRTFIDTLRERQVDIKEVGDWTITPSMQRGYDAYMDGRSIVDSPWHPGTPDDREFCTGWKLAQYEHPAEGFNKENE